MSVYVEPFDEADDTAFGEPCKYGHEECSDTWYGECTIPQGTLNRSAANVLSVISRFPDGICTPHIVKHMLDEGISEGALSVTKRITELRRAGFRVVGGTMHQTYCTISSHRHSARVGFYLLDY